MVFFEEKAFFKVVVAKCKVPFCFKILLFSLYNSQSRHSYIRILQIKNNKDNISESSPPVSPARLHCCYAVIIVLTGAVIAVSMALSGK